jgi:putative ABC transport system permease protein
VLKKFKYRFRFLFDKATAEQDLDGELRFHLEQEIHENIQGGMDPASARQAALRKFGGVEQIKEECRDVGGAQSIEILWQDIRYAFRLLRKKPKISALIVLILGFGIGVSGSLSSVIDGAFLHPFGYTDLKRFMTLNQTFPRKEQSSYFFSVSEYFDILNSNHAFAGVAAIRELSVNLVDGENPERVLGCAVTSNTFVLAGDPPIRGRMFSAEEDRPGGEKVVVISHRLWQRRYAGNSAILNGIIKLNGESYTVIGIAPPRFLLWDADLWVPLRLNVADNDRSRRDLFLTALLKPGISRDQGNLDLTNVARQLEQQHAGTNPEYAGFQLIANKLQEAAFKDLQPALITLLVAVSLLLVISYSNVGNLLLSRAMARKKEIALRMALGASPSRIMRLFALEALFLSIAGGLVGFAIINWCAPLLAAMIPPYYLSPEAEIGTSYRLFGITIGLSLVMGLVVAGVPALQAFKINLLDSLKEGGRNPTSEWSARHLRSALVVGEVALTLVVLVGAGLIIKSYLRLTQTPLGFNHRGVLTMRIALPRSKYPESSQVVGFYQQLLAKISALPGVETSTLVSSRLMSEGNVQDFAIEGRDQTGAGALPNANYRIITPEYFRVTGIPLRQGRQFTEKDDANVPQVAVINETMARRFWPNESSLGKRIKLVNVDARTNAQAEPVPASSLMIVGVVGDARQRSNLLREIDPEFYLPFLQRVSQSRDMALMVRTKGDPAALTRAVRQQLMTLDAEQPVYEVLTLSKIVDTAFGPKRLAVALLLIFAALSLLLAAVGLYTIISNSVAERTHEIGIRMALGAGRTNVLKLVLHNGLKLALTGLAIGLFAAFALTRLMATMLFGVSATDPLVFLNVSVLLVMVTLLASYFPARRATAVDPIIALRHE